MRPRTVICLRYDTTNNAGFRFVYENYISVPSFYIFLVCDRSVKRRKFVQLVPVGLVTVTTAGCVGENVEEPEDTDGTTPDTQPPAGDGTGGVSEDDGGTTGDESGEATAGVELAIVDTATEAPEDADVRSDRSCRKRRRRLSDRDR